MGTWSVPEAIDGPAVSPVGVQRVDPAVAPVISQPVGPRGDRATSVPVASRAVALVANREWIAPASPEGSRLVDPVASPVVADPERRVRDEVMTARFAHHVRWVHRSPRKSISPSSIRSS